MINAILLRSRMSRKAHVRFWSRVGRSNLLGLGNSKLLKVMPIAKAKICSAIPQTLRLFGEPYDTVLRVKI